MNNASNNIGKREKVSTTRVAGQFRGFLCAYVHSYYRILGFFACCRCNPKSKNKSLTLKKIAYATFDTIVDIISEFTDFVIYKLSRTKKKKKKKS